MPQVAEFDQRENPYRATAAVPAAYPGEGLSSELVQCLASYVGPRSEYYLRKWAPKLEDPNAEAGMNWAAFFLTAFWFGYRKMYKATFILFGASIGVGILQAVVFMGILRQPGVPPLVSLVVNLMFAIVCGVYANTWYLNQAKREIINAHSKGLEGEHLYFALSQRGGTSLLASLGLVFGMSFILTALLFVGMIVAVVIAGVPR
jgi:hypothetical protein